MNKLTPKEYRELHQTRRSLFFSNKKGLMKRKEELEELNPNASFNFFKCLGGENKGKWLLHIRDAEGVRF